MVFHCVVFDCRFRINSRSGVVSVAPCSTPGRGSCLDYEQQNLYNLTVVTADRYGDGIPSRADLWIYIRGVDDNPPVFSAGDEIGSIKEYAETLESPVQVEVKSNAISSFLWYFFFC